MITIQELSMKCTTSYDDARRTYQLLTWKAMVCRLPKMANDGTCQMSGVMVVSKWDITLTHQNPPTINQAPTKAMIQMTTAVRQPHKEEMESMR